MISKIYHDQLWDNMTCTEYGDLCSLGIILFHTQNICIEIQLHRKFKGENRHNYAH